MKNILFVGNFSQNLLTCLLTWLRIQEIQNQCGPGSETLITFTGLEALRRLEIRIWLTLKKNFFLNLNFDFFSLGAIQKWLCSPRSSTSWVTSRRTCRGQRYRHSASSASGTTTSWCRTHSSSSKHLYSTVGRVADPHLSNADPEPAPHLQNLQGSIYSLQASIFVSVHGPPRF